MSFFGASNWDMTSNCVSGVETYRVNSNGRKGFVKKVNGEVVASLIHTTRETGGWNREAITTTTTLTRVGKPTVTRRVEVEY